MKSNSDDSIRDFDTFVQKIVKCDGALKIYLRGLLPKWDDVEEVSQQSALIAWQKFSELKELDKFQGWLFAIARFEALKARRKVARSPLVFDDDLIQLIASEQIGPTFEQELNVVLENCLAKLTKEKRALIIQTYQHGIKMNSLAEQMKVSVQSLYKSIQRIRLQLLQCIERNTHLEGL